MIKDAPKFVRKMSLLYTNRCPLTCRHCVVSASPERTDKMDIGLAERAIRDAAAWGVLTVGFSGGEPLLYWEEIAELRIAEVL